MKPMTEKMTNPENKLVELLMHEMMNASLYVDNTMPYGGGLV